MNRVYYLLFSLLILSSCKKTEDIDNNILRLYGDALEDIGYSIAKSDDGYVISGQLTDVVRAEPNIIDKMNSVRKMGIIKISHSGDEIWKRTYGDQSVNVGSKAIVLEDGSVVCVGYAVNTVSLYKEVFIVKTDKQGNPVIQKSYKSPDGKSNQYGIDILKTTSGFLVLGVTDAEKAGTSDSTGNIAGKKDILVMKLDNNLIQIESWAAGYPGDDEGVSIKPDNGGGFIVLASTDRSDKPASSQSRNNILLVKINSAGNFVEQRIIGGLAEENASDIEVLDDGYLVVATAGTEVSGLKGYVWKLSRNIFDTPIYAHEISIQSSSGPLSFRVNAVSRYKINYFVMAGQSGTGSSARNLVFLTDEEGNIMPGKSVISGATGSQSLNDVISDNEGNIYAVGKNSYENNSMISLLKFRF